MDRGKRRWRADRIELFLVRLVLVVAITAVRELPEKEMHSKMIGGLIYVNSDSVRETKAKI